MKLSGSILLFVLLIISCNGEDMLNGTTNNTNGKTSNTYKNPYEAAGIPDAVAKAFDAKFPGASINEWELEGDTYEVEFTYKGEKLEAEFDSNGKWILTEKKINISDLPEPVMKTIKSEFPGYEVEEAESVESVELGFIYEVELEKAGQEIEVYIDASGKILGSEEEGDEDEDDDDDGDEG